MGNYTSLVVVGSSGAGKTTLVNAVRTPEFSEKVFVPQRFITRPERQNDDSGENTHLDQFAFELGVRDGLIEPYWQRILGDMTVKYGFESGDDDGRLRVYSANNAFLRDRNRSVEKVLEGGLVVVVMAPMVTRSARLSERSPDMSPEERAARISDVGDDILGMSLPKEVIDTTELSLEEGQAAMRSLVDSAIG